jgi:hypothetical protein
VVVVVVVVVVGVVVVVVVVGPAKWSLNTRALCVLRLQMEETTSRYGCCE